MPALRIFPFFLSLLLLNACSPSLEKQLFMADYELEKSFLLSENQDEALAKYADKYLPAFLSYLDRVSTIQIIANKRIDSLEKVDTWPKEVEGLENDPRFRIIAKSHFSGTGQETGIRVEVEYLKDELIISSNERLQLMEGLVNVPGLIQNRIILGRSKWVRVPVSLKPDSVINLFDSELPSIWSFKSYILKHKYLPENMISGSRSYFLNKKYDLAYQGKFIEVPVSFGKAKVYSQENIANIFKFYKNFSGGRELLAVKGEFRPLEGDYLVMFADEPLNVMWVIDIPDRNSVPLSQPTFEEYMSSRPYDKRFQDSVILISYKKDLDGLIKLFERGPERPMDNKEFQASRAQSLAYFLDLKKALEDNSDKSDYFLAQARLEQIPPAQSIDYQLVYKKLQKSLIHNERNLEAYKNLATLFNRGYLGRNVALSLNITREQLDFIKKNDFKPEKRQEWLDKIYAYGIDSVSTYEFLVFDLAMGRDPFVISDLAPDYIEKGIDLSNEAVERFPRDIRAYNSRADFIATQKFPVLLSHERRLWRYEQDLLNELGEADSLMPLLFEEMGFKMQISELEYEEDPERRTELRKAVIEIREKRAFIRRELESMAKLAKADAEFLIQQQAGGWKGYWLRAVARYWLNERVEAQVDHCIAQDLYDKDPTSLPGKQAPTYTQPFYKFESCLDSKS
ncbi:MAG: hypothetical protein MRZ79_15360 [Bacteroidia bacterium]|nr:hypothetical protein [Bacteroidia bacterium]